MVENAFQIKSEITINVSVNIEISKKNIMGVIKIIFGILPHVLVKTVNI